jgi:sugar lactone lactonase YvrE
VDLDREGSAESVRHALTGRNTLYVTFASFNLAAETLMPVPLSGCHFALDVGVRGLPVHAFGDRRR